MYFIDNKSTLSVFYFFNLNKFYKFDILNASKVYIEEIYRLYFNL